jgi:hypothetical protein
MVVATLTLGLQPKQRGLQSCRPKGSLGVTLHALRSVGKCEGMNPHTPKATPTLGDGVLVDFWIFKIESSKGDCRGQNSMAWIFHYINGMFLKCRCLKWAHVTNLDIWNTNYGKKKGRWESNWQFDSWPLKVRNWPRSLAWRWCATYRWKSFNEGYNFALDLISIGGLRAKLWDPKVAGVPTLASSGLPLGPTWESRDKNAIWMWASWRGTKYTIRGKVVASPKSGPWWVLWIRICSWFILAPKVLKLCINQLVVWFYAGPCE